MPTSVNVTNLKINELTESQYDSAVQGGVIGANELSILTDVDAGQVIQVATLPTASADELGNIYQFTGTTDANYTNGYFYKCVSDGQTPATYSWTAVQVQAGGGGSATSTTATLATAGWSNNTQTVNVTGVTASNNVIVAAAPASQSAWTAAGVICTAQGAGTLTFTCTTTPSVALTANILIL